MQARASQEQPPAGTRTILGPPPGVVLGARVKVRLEATRRRVDRSSRFSRPMNVSMCSVVGAEEGHGPATGGETCGGRCGKACVRACRACACARHVGMCAHACVKRGCPLLAAHSHAGPHPG